MKLIVGLGNPGEKYKKTRHNIGFMVVEHFLMDYATVGKTVWSFSPKLKSDIAIIEWQPRTHKMEKVILAKPRTYMNNSGMAVSLASLYYKIAPEDIWIIHDEIDLPLGTMRIRFGGASAGNHGIESIMESLKTEKFWRFRMGIGEKHEKTGEMAKHLHKNVEDYVLGSFSAKQKSKVKDLIKKGCHAAQLALEEGLEAAMNKCNTK